jgi:hypothetical protein
MYSFNITDKTERRAILEVTEDITSNLIELRGVSLFEGINQIELEEPLTGVEGYVVESTSIPNGCVVESIEDHKLNLSLAPTKDVKSAKIVLKQVVNKELFTIQVSLSKLNDLISCRSTIAIEGKQATAHLTKRD